jgi:hypothetical protein
MPLAGRDPTNETPPAKNPGCPCQSVVGGLVEDDYKADDLAVTHAEVVRQNKIVGQIGPVERTLVGFIPLRSLESAVQVQPFAVWPEHHDRLHRTVDHAEPMRRPCRELHGFTGIDSEIALAEDKSQLT